VVLPMPDATVMTSTCEDVDGKTGKLFPVGENQACRVNRSAVGRCHAGACCTGCWTGTACVAGTAEAACGKAGAACEDLTNQWTCVVVTPANAVVGGCRLAARESTCVRRTCVVRGATECCQAGQVPGTGKCRTP
jgi:hypothetical protein